MEDSTATVSITAEDVLADPDSLLNHFCYCMARRPHSTPAQTSAALLTIWNSLGDDLRQTHLRRPGPYETMRSYEAEIQRAVESVRRYAEILRRLETALLRADRLRAQIAWIDAQIEARYGMTHWELLASSSTSSAAATSTTTLVADDDAPQGDS